MLVDELGPTLLPAGRLASAVAQAVHAALAAAARPGDEPAARPETHSAPGADPDPDAAETASAPPRRRFTRDELLEEWEWLRGEVALSDFGRRMRISQQAWERSYQRAHEPGIPARPDRAVS